MSTLLAVRALCLSFTLHIQLLSPVFLAILQQCVSISAGSVCTHIRVSSSHGTGRDVILEKESEIQNHMNV